MATAARKSFHNYLKLRELFPVGAWAWAVGRNLSIAATLAVAALLFVRPHLGLLLFWKVAVPVLPAVFLLAPGLWRNLCPLAASNQAPRLAGRTAQREAPAWWKEYGYVIGFVLFFALATSRKFLFNHDGPATALLVLAALTGAFVGGWFLKGKSGWCSSVCPLYPVQRLYNQTPFLIVPNAHCDPCVGCTRNCYDFNPMAAHLADLHEEDRYYVGYRRLFAYCMPGFVVGYFTLPDPPAIGIPALFGAMLLHLAASSGIFLAAESLLKTSLNRLVSVAAAAAILSFYLLGFGKWLVSASDLLGLPHPAAWVAHAGTAVFALVLLLWLARTRAKEKRYLRMISRQREQATVGPDATTTLRTATASAKSEIRFEPSGKTLAFQAGKTLLEIAESGGLPIQSGCRMGACGADPVRILEGEGNLSPMGADERATLERLGLGDGVRLACACRPKGGVAVSLDPRSGAGAAKSELVPSGAEASVKSFDRGIRSVVVVGNGVAGTTAADHVRRLHPECEIHLVARERHPLYNRMGIEKLVHGRTASTLR